MEYLIVKWLHICFRQLDLAHFDGLIWPTRMDVDGRTASLCGSGCNG